MTINVGDYIYNYCGAADPHRDKTKDKDFVRQYKVIDIVSDSAKAKYTLLVKMMIDAEVDSSNRCWFSDIGHEYNIKVVTV